MDDRLRIRMLGRLSVSRSGRPLALPTRKTAALLAVQAGRVVARERLADLLWPRSPPAQARARLRQALAQLRRVLGDAEPEVSDPVPGERALAQLRRVLGDAADGVLVTAADGLQLRTEHVEFDVAELETALGDGSPGALTRAAQPYAGDLLESFSAASTTFDEWRRATT